MTVRTMVRSLRDKPAIRGGLITLCTWMRQVGVPIGKRLYQHLPYVGVVEVDVPGGRAFRMHAMGGAVENGLYWEGLRSHEPASMQGWVTHARNAGCVLDIGANAGIFALAAAGAGAISVHAFEPLPRVHALLADNVRLNAFDGLKSWQLAVGSIPGVAMLFDPGFGESAPTSASLSVEFTHSHFGDLPGVPVEVVTIDDFCARERLPRVDLVKLDVEGYEEHALRGMTGVLLRDKPMVLMEVLPEFEAALRNVVAELLADSYDWMPICEGDGGPNRNVWLRPKGFDADR